MGIFLGGSFMGIWGMPAVPEIVCYKQWMLGPSLCMKNK